MKAPKHNIVRAVDFTAADTDGRLLEGYAAVFGSRTSIDSWEGRFDEVIERGAFAKTLAERTPVLQFDHGHDSRTGTVPIGAIRDLHEDDHGLFVRAELFDNDLVRPIRDAIAGGAINGMSFRFSVVRDQWTRDDGLDIRAIKEVSLHELGPVVFPAYSATSVAVRSELGRLSDDERRSLLAELADQYGVPVRSDAAHEGTSDDIPDAAHEGTSGFSADMRTAVLRSLALKELA